MGKSKRPPADWLTLKAPGACVSRGVNIAALAGDAPASVPVVVVPVPPRLSDLTNNVPGVGRVPSKKYRRWQREAGPLFRALPKPHRFPVVVCITIVGGKGFRSSADACNREKATNDALVKAGVLPDDNVTHVAHCVLRFVQGKRTRPSAAVVSWRYPTPDDLAELASAIALVESSPEVNG